MLPLFVLLAWAAATDLHARRIPNWLTLALASMGIAHNIWPTPTVGPADAIAGLLVGFVLNVGLFALGVRGGGDVKLFAAVGAWIGVRDVLIVFLMVAILDMVWAVTQCAMQGRLRLLATNTVMLAGSMKRMGSLADEGEQALSPAEGPQPMRSAGKRLPCAVTILVATLAVLLMGRSLQWPF